MVVKEQLTQGYAWRVNGGNVIHEYGLASQPAGWSIIRTSMGPNSNGWQREVVARDLSDDEAVAYLNLILYNGENDGY
jgi:hypothetical protein